MDVKVDYALSLLDVQVLNIELTGHFFLAAVAIGRKLCSCLISPPRVDFQLLIVGFLCRLRHCNYYYILSTATNIQMSTLQQRIPR